MVLLVFQAQILPGEQIPAVDQKLRASHNGKAVVSSVAAAVRQKFGQEILVLLRRGIKIVCNILQAAALEQIGKPGGIVKINIIVRLFPLGILLNESEELAEGKKVKVQMDPEFIEKLVADGFQRLHGGNVRNGNIQGADGVCGRHEAPPAGSRKLQRVTADGVLDQMKAASSCFFPAFQWPRSAPCSFPCPGNRPGGRYGRNDIRIEGGTVPVFHVQGNDADILGNAVHGQIAGLDDSLTERLGGGDDGLRGCVDPGVKECAEGAFLGGVGCEDAVFVNGDPRSFHGILKAGNTF